MSKEHREVVPRVPLDRDVPSEPTDTDVYDEDEVHAEEGEEVLRPMIIMYECLNCRVSFPAAETHVCGQEERSLNPLHPANEDNWKHRAENMRCRTCMWYVPKTEKLGRCRANSPTIKGWPALFPTDWCGNHKLDEDAV